jgi:hypothetical protein
MRVQAYAFLRLVEELEALRASLEAWRSLDAHEAVNVLADMAGAGERAPCPWCAQAGAHTDACPTRKDAPGAPPAGEGG